MNAEDIKKLIESDNSLWTRLWSALRSRAAGDHPDVLSTVSRMVAEEILWQDRFEGKTSPTVLETHSLPSLRAEWLTLRNRRSAWQASVDPDSTIVYTESNGAMKILKMWEGVIEMISTTQFYRGQLAVQMSQLAPPEKTFVA